MKWTLGTVAFGVCSLVGQTGWAAPPLRIDLVEKAPVLDGVPGEWQRELAKLGSNLKGAPAPTDLTAKGAVAYDGKSLYVAVDVTDDTLKGGGNGDRVDLTVVVGSSSTVVSIFPGDPGKSPGKATAKGQAISGAKVVEAPRKGGWTLEASIPWAAIDGATSTRVGMRGSLAVFDADGASVDAAVGTAPSTDPAQLPALATTPEQALTDGLMKDKRLGAPTFQGTANVVGDGMKERVLVFDHYLVVLGPSYRGGKQYYFADMAVSGASMSVVGLETRDMDGDGRDDLVLRKRFTKTGQKTTREVLHVLSYGTGDVPELIFQHEIGISNPKGSIANEVAFATEASKVTITVRAGGAKGLDEASYDEPTEGSFDPVLLPWGAIQSQTYKLQKGRAYVRTGEERRARPAAAEAPAQKPIAEKAQPAPAPPDVGKVLALYKKDRSVNGSARFDLSADVAGDATAERVLLFDRDIVVAGPKFKAGTGYAFTTLSFASGADIKSVAVRDVTGDKKADVVVRGVLKAKGPANEEVSREIELVFKVTEAGLKRVFGAEVARFIGPKRVDGSIKYESQGNAAVVVLGPGRATGFTKENYPFGQDSGPVGGLEPLMLPWGGAAPARYKWTGNGFDRQ